MKFKTNIRAARIYLKQYTIHTQTSYQGLGVPISNIATTGK